MKKCTWCGKEQADEAEVCAFDGQPLVDAANPSSSKRQCAICGESLLLGTLLWPQVLCPECTKFFGEFKSVEELNKAVAEQGWLFNVYTWQTPEVSAAQYITSGPLLGAAINQAAASFQQAGFFWKDNQFFVRADLSSGSEMRFLNQIILGASGNPNSNQISPNRVSEIRADNFKMPKRFSTRDWLTLVGFTFGIALLIGFFGYTQTKKLETAVFSALLFAFGIQIVFFLWLAFWPADPTKAARAKGLILVRFILSGDRVLPFAIKKSQLIEINMKLTPYNLKIPEPSNN